MWQRIMYLMYYMQSEWKTFQVEVGTTHALCVPFVGGVISAATVQTVICGPHMLAIDLSEVCL